MYRYLYRKEYNAFGYRWVRYDLPSWIYLTVEFKGIHGKVLVVHSSIHVNKRVVMNPSYSDEFTDDEIIKDLSAKVSQQFI